MGCRHEKHKFFPLFITNNCNLKCKMCLRGYKRGLNIEKPIIKKLLSEIKKAGYNGFAITGGEPCLYNDFEGLIKYICDEGFYFTIVSNGYYLEKYLFIIKRYRNRLLNIKFSFDGPDEESHDFIRGKGSYERVVKTVRYFVRKKIRTGISVCLNKFNADKIENFIQLAKNLKVNSIVFSAVIKTEFNKNLFLNESIRKLCIDKIYKNKLKYPGFIYVNPSIVTGGGINFCPLMNEEETITVNPLGGYTFCCN